MSGAGALAPRVARPDVGEDAPPPLRVWLRLLSCANGIERRVRGRLRDRFASTLPRFDLLAQLDAAARDGEDGLTMTALSRRLMVTNGNLTALIERLAGEGLVHRETAAHDRRLQVVRLTSAGARALAAMTPDHRAWIDAMFAGLTPDERRQLHELVGKLKTSTERAFTTEDA